MLAGARTDVDDLVGDADGVLVVLDDDHRVAEVAQADQRVDQPLVVALVQTDRRLVEHVQRADETAADLAASRMRCASPPASVPAERSRREVVEADVEQEPRRALISFVTRSAIMPVALDSSSAARNLDDSPIDRSHTSEMFWSSIVTASVAGFSRAPPHAEHGTSRM